MKTFIEVESTREKSLYDAFREAVNKALTLAYHEPKTIDIVLSQNDDSHTYTVLSSITSERRVGTPCLCDVKTWFNEKLLAKLNIDINTAKKDILLHDILSIAFNQVGMFHSHAEHCGKLAQEQVDRAYSFLCNKILEHFELKNSDNKKRF